MISARFLGYSRTESARFSLLLAIVAITGAGVLSTRDLLMDQNAALGISALIAAALSFAAGYAAIAILLRTLAKVGFLPFAVYTLVVAVAGIVVF